LFALLSCLLICRCRFHINNDASLSIHQVLGDIEETINIVETKCLKQLVLRLIAATHHPTSLRQSTQNDYLIYALNYAEFFNRIAQQQSFNIISLELLLSIEAVSRTH